MILKSLVSILFIVSALYSIELISMAHAQSTRSLSGTLTLDTGVASNDYPIDITVRNHSLVVVPPFFQIIRPITSRASARVMLPAGESQLSYQISNIITDPVDYSIEIRCDGCGDSIPTQYFAPGGNRFGLPDDVFIDPEDLAQTLSLTAITRAKISGTIGLHAQQIAGRDLRFEISVVNSQIPQIVYQITNIVLAPGTSHINYQLTGLPRETSGADYRVRLRCTNCFGRASALQSFMNTLSTSQNHTEIDFTVTGTNSVAVPAVIDLLLNE